MLYDSHAHYDDRQFDADRTEVITAAHKCGVGYINNIASDIETSKTGIALAEEFDFVYATVGVHPSEVGGMTQADIDWLKNAAKHEKVVAIGEIGLDYHYDDTSEEEQKLWL